MAQNGLAVTWFDAWHPSLDDALQLLPESDSCPHELYRLLMQTPCSMPLRTALVTDQGRPVAVVGLRRKGHRSWEPITQWIIPGVVFPAEPAYIMPTIEALGVDIWVAWWRMANPPSPSQQIRYIESAPVYRISLKENFEQYWRDNGFFKTIRRVRNRCRDLTLAINAPGTAEWTVRNWEAKWRENPAIVDTSLPARLVTAEYLSQRGKYYTLSLSDGDKLAAGASIMVHGKDLVAGVFYRDPDYHHHGVGDRLIDLSFAFGVENGFETIDLGGGHDYKKHWAKPDGERWFFNACPELLYRAKQVTNWMRDVRNQPKQQLTKIIRRTA